MYEAKGVCFLHGWKEKGRKGRFLEIRTPIFYALFKMEPGYNWGKLR